MRAAVALLGLLVLGCGVRGNRGLDEPCQSDGDCASGMCVMEPFVGATCKDPCGGNDANCPAGQICSGVAAGYVTYCEPDFDEATP